MDGTLPHGLWPVMLTSFGAGGAIDWAGVDALTEWYVSSGAAGLFACCLSSEMYALTPHERLSLADRVVRRAAGRVPVVATGTFGGAVQDQAAFVRQMAETGVAAVVVVTSQLVAAEAEETAFRDALGALVERTDPIPLGLYECPVPYKRLLEPATLGWLASTGRFLYLKDTSCDLPSIEAKLAAIGGTPLGLYNAHTPTALASLQAGAAGISPIAGNYYAALYAWLCARHGAQPERARALQRMLTLMEGVARSHYPTAAKVYLKRGGLAIQPFCREQQVELSADELGLLDNLAEVVGELAETYGAP